MAKRFIKLYEQITRWGWYTNVNTAHLFIHLLLKANYGESECAGQKICRGQMLTSLPALAAGHGPDGQGSPDCPCASGEDRGSGRQIDQQIPPDYDYEVQ